MATIAPIRKKILNLKKEYDKLKKGKDSLLSIIDESEIVEQVYNSNAIENSTLTIKETEKILLEMEVDRNVSLREVFEAKNLARIIEYIRQKATSDKLNIDMVLLLHKMLITNIRDEIAGRFRQKDEYVRVGTHIAPAPEHVEDMLEEAFDEYENDIENFYLDKIARFHLEFENIHPFLDGNGRIGRVIINYQLFQLGLPPVIIRFKERKYYYQSFHEYDDKKTAKRMEKILALSLMESLHKRITYLKGNKIIPLAEYTKKNKKSASAVLNLARRQTIPAFREKGTWKIGENF